MTMTGKLATLAGGATQVTSTSEVNVVGILAQMGSRVITEVSNIMFDKFSQNFQAQLEQSADQPTIASHRGKGRRPNRRRIDRMAGVHARDRRLAASLEKLALGPQSMTSSSHDSSLPKGIKDVDTLVHEFERLGYVTDALSPRPST